MLKFVFVVFYEVGLIIFFKTLLIKWVLFIHNLIAKHVVFSIVTLIDWLIPEVPSKIQEQLGREATIVQHALWEQMSDDQEERARQDLVFYDIDEFSDDEDDSDSKKKRQSEQNIDVYINESNTDVESS